MNGSQLKNALTRYISFTQMDTRPDREKGKRDGTQNYPAAGSNDLSPHELERVSQAKASMSSYFRQLHDMESRLQQEISQREQERDNGYLTSKESVIREKEAAIENLQQQYGPGSETHRQLASDLEHRAEETRRIELLVNRPLRAHFSRSYFAILALLSLLEVPINKLAFEFFFEESPIIAFVLALTVGGVLVALAHFLGMWLRQWGYHRNFSETGKANTAGIATILLVVGTLIYLVSALRQQYVDFLSQEQSSSMSSMLMQEGITGFLGQSVTSGLGSAGLTLLVVNVAVFMLGTMLSMLRRDSHPDYERVVGLHEVAQTRMNRFLRRSSTDPCLPDSQRRVALGPGAFVLRRNRTHGPSRSRRGGMTVMKSMIRNSLRDVFALALLAAISQPAVAAKQDYCEMLKGDTVVFVVDRRGVRRAGPGNIRGWHRKALRFA